MSKLNIKIAIITPFNSGNIGTLLQAYATQQVITRLGYDLEIVDFAYKASNNPFLLSNLRRRGLKNYLMAIAGHLTRLPKMKKVRAFISENLKLSKPIRESSELTSLNEIYDHFIVGSDAVWNSGPFGLEKAYLLNFVTDNSKKGNYASSFASETVPDEQRKDYAFLLGQFKFLSAREKKGKEIIKDLIGTDVPVVLDPTLLLDSQFWSDFAEKSVYSKRWVMETTVEYWRKRDYIFVAEYSISEKMLSDAERLAALMGCDIVCAFPPKGKRIRARTMLKADPFDFIYLVKKANYVLTDSFHTTVFSINLGVPFMSYVTNRTALSVSRFESIFEILGINDRLIYDTKDKRSDISADSFGALDFKNIHKILEEERGKSMKYLRNQLNYSGNNTAKEKP